MSHWGLHCGQLYKPSWQDLERTFLEVVTTHALYIDWLICFQWSCIAYIPTKLVCMNGIYHPLQDFNCGATQPNVCSHASKGVYTCAMQAIILLWYMYMSLHGVSANTWYSYCYMQVKDCYLVHLVEELHDTQKMTLILFTHTCRWVPQWYLVEGGSYYYIATVDHCFVLCFQELSSLLPATEAAGTTLCGTAFATVTGKWRIPISHLPSPKYYSYLAYVYSVCVCVCLGGGHF